MIDIRDPHSDVHSEHGALPGEHPGRAANPIVKVYDVAWLEFEKPDLERTERFAEAFGFTTAWRTANELHLRGSDPGSPCVLVRKAPRSRFVGPTFRAADSSDVTRLAKATGAKVEQLPETGRPQRDAGAARGRPSRASRAAGPRAAHLQRRP
jgi:hypothetical protein